ncbi:tripartite tricarboxylate transporter substrate binding protein [Humitalea sp. 24SJ18S-53]|uniref:tripartite tricarboxylate transporter substrate binding protein n=1 Tax=Humitalea sp. 24SJ18S-53 TaxID=3422307 RepID=UPI003D67784D
MLNRAGAAGETAYNALQTARPDGYTIGWLATPGYVAMGVERPVRFDRAKIRPIARLIDDPAALMVRADSPFRTLRDLVDAAKRNPESISIGSSSIGTVSHLGLTLLQAASGARFIHAPFAGTGPVKNALLGGHIDVGGLVVGELGTMGQDRASLRVLTVMARQRVELIPSVPTALEDGYDVVISGERGIAAPIGISDDVALKLQASVEALLVTPNFLDRARSLELPLAYLSGAAWSQRMAEQEALYRRVWASTPWM